MKWWRGASSCWIHKSLRVIPAMVAGINNELRDVEWIVGLIEAREPRPGPLN